MRMKKVAGYGPVTEIEFLRKNNNRTVTRQKKIRTIRIRSFHVILIIILFVLTGYAAYSVGKFVTGWERFEISSFRIINSPHFRNEAVRDILKKYRGNILTLNTRLLSSELLRIREIGDVSITRKLPSTVEIRFVLRTPAFQFFHEGSYHIVDRNGVIISEMKEKMEDIMMIRDVRPEDLEKIFPGLSGLIENRELIDYISFVEPYGTALKLKGTGEIFYTGNETGFDRIRQYLKLRKKLGYDEKDIRSVDLRFSKRFYLEFEKEII